jgi:hypothetical protein
MDTDQLIRTLAADNTHQARPVGFALMLALLAAAPVSLLMFFAEFGVRPDIMVAMRNPFFDLKLPSACISRGPKPRCAVSAGYCWPRWGSWLLLLAAR